MTLYLLETPVLSCCVTKIIKEICTPPLICTIFPTSALCSLIIFDNEH